VPGPLEAVELLQERPCGLIFCDRNFLDGNYRELLLAIRSHKIKTRVVIVARLTDWDEYLESMKLGAFDVINAPCRPTDVEWMLIQANRDYRNAYLHAAGLPIQEVKRSAVVN
jgi:DNA-binding NtrC family response regulator